MQGIVEKRKVEGKRPGWGDERCSFPLCRAEPGPPLQGTLLPKPRCGSRFSVTHTMSGLASSARLFLQLSCDSGGRIKAPYLGFPPKSVGTQQNAHTSKQEQLTANLPSAWEQIAEHIFDWNTTGPTLVNPGLQEWRPWQDGRWTGSVF